MFIRHKEISKQFLWANRVIKKTEIGLRLISGLSFKTYETYFTAIFMHLFSNCTKIYDVHLRL